MVEQVEEFKAQFNFGLLRDPRILIQAEGKVVDAGPVEVVAAGVAKHSARLRRKGVGIEIVVCSCFRSPVRGVYEIGIPWVIGLDGTHHVRAIRAAIAGVIPTNERIVAAIRKADWEPGLEDAVAGKPPSIRQAGRQAAESIEMPDGRNRIRITDDEPLTGVIGGVAVIVVKIKGVKGAGASDVFHTGDRVQGV